MRKIVAIFAGLAAPLLFPAIFAIVIVFLAAVVVPPIGLVAGILSDAVYHTAGQGLPYGTLIGLFITGIGYVVHRFIKTRIMAT